MPMWVAPCRLTPCVHVMRAHQGVLMVGMANNGSVAGGMRVFAGFRARKSGGVSMGHTFWISSHPRAVIFIVKSGPPWLLSPEGLLDLMICAGIRGHLLVLDSFAWVIPRACFRWLAFSHMHPTSHSCCVLLASSLDLRFFALESV